MYSVRDEMTGKFMQPMFVEADDNADTIAIRQFRSNVKNIQLWKDNPNDYNLYITGVFDDETGTDAVMVSKIASGRSFIDGKD